MADGLLAFLDKKRILQRYIGETLVIAKQVESLLPTNTSADVMVIRANLGDTIQYLGKLREKLDAMTPGDEEEHLAIALATFKVIFHEWKQWASELLSYLSSAIVYHPDIEKIVAFLAKQLNAARDDYFSE